MNAVEGAEMTARLQDFTDRLPGSEERYRALFDAIDQGFCVVEMVFDETNRPLDYRFLEVNAAFEAQTGLADPVGRTMRSLRPAHEEHWFEIYGGIALSGKPTRFERPAAALGRWYEVYAFPIGESGQRHVGILFNDITQRKRDEERFRLLATEIDHRAKNMLTIVSSLIHLTGADTVEEYKTSLLGRIAALASSQRLLSESRGKGAELAKLVRDEMAPYRTSGGDRVACSGPAVTLPPVAAQSMAMVLHELAANAIKYGALSVPEGRVSLEWSWLADGRLGLRWSESGGPPVAAPARPGTGTGVITGSVEGQLGGEVRFDWHPEGLHCQIAVPVDR